MTDLAEATIPGGGNTAGRDDGRLGVRLGRLEMVARQMEPLVWGMVRPQGESLDQRLERLLSLSPQYEAEPAWWADENGQEAHAAEGTPDLQEMSA